MLGSSSDIETVQRLLAQFRSEDPMQHKVAQQMQRFADVNGDNALSRTCAPGHFTASSLVLDQETGHFVMLFHTKLQRWLQPGGHVDGSSNLAAAALREATEETGIDDLIVVVPAIDLDIHEVRPPKEPPHLHYDVRFLVLAPAGSQLVPNHESRDSKWVSLDELGNLDVDVSVARLAHRGFEVARKLKRKV